MSTFKSSRQRKAVMSRLTQARSSREAKANFKHADKVYEKEAKNKFKVGDAVYYLNNPLKEKYKVYGIYSKNEVSLGLRDYPGSEQDYLTNIKDIKKFKKRK